MNRSQTILFAKCVTVLAAIPAMILAHAVGAPPRVTGAPGDDANACTQCHLGTPLNGGGGKVEVSYSGGTSYVPGTNGKFTVTITDSAAARYGFEASARLVSDLANGQAGTLVAGAGTHRADAGSVQFLTHSTPNRTNTFEFDWTPPNAGAGDVRVFVAGNAANGNGNNSGDHIYTANLTLTEGQASGGDKPAVSDGGVANSFSFQPGVAGSTLVSIFGTNLASETVPDWNNTPEVKQGKVPFTISGVSVTINGKPAPIYGVSPKQVNILAPIDDATGTVPLVVKTAAGESAPVTVNRSNFLPSLLTTTTAGGLRVIARWNDQPNTILGLPVGNGTRPFKPGDLVQFYATGLGPTNPVVPSDSFVTTPAPVVTMPTIRINDVPVEVLGAVLVSPAFYQVNGRLPDLPDGDLPVVIEVGGVRSPDTIKISVQK
jgi:uncharacterized protein (TIGR03437 family)